MSTKASSFIKTASIITIVTLISKMFGFLREASIAYFFGTSREVDMYLMAINIPTVILGFVTCIGTALTPVYTEITVDGGKKKSLGFLTQLLLIVSIICICIILICTLNAKWIISIVAPGFSEAMMITTAKYLKISLWNLLIVTIMNIFICYLNCNGKYTYAAFAMLFHSSIQIIFTFLAHVIGPVFLTVGYLLANLCYLCALLCLSLKSSFRIITPYFDAKYEKMLLKLIIPIGISSFVTQINGYIDKYFATNLVAGSISALHYSNTIRTFIIMMLNTGLITMFYPVMSKFVAEKKYDKVKETLLSSVRYVIIVFIPVTILLLFFSDLITKILFQRGAFDSNSVLMTSTAIRMYAIGITAVALRDIFLNYLYSVKNSILPLIISIVAIIINTLLNMLLIDRMGIGGLALATSISAIVSIPICVACILKDKTFNDLGENFGRFLLKCFLANLFPLLLLLVCNTLFATSGMIFAIIISMVYLILIFICLKFLNIEETELVVNLGKKFFGKVFKCK